MLFAHDIATERRTRGVGLKESITREGVTMDLNVADILYLLKWLVKPSSTGVWIVLNDALKLVAAHPFFGEAPADWLLRQLRENRLPARFCERKPHGYDGSVRRWGIAPAGPVDLDGGPIEAAVWARNPEIHWEQSWAWVGGLFGPPDPYDLFGIEVPLAVLEALLPGSTVKLDDVEQQPAETEPDISAVPNTAALVNVEARRMKSAGGSRR